MNTKELISDAYKVGHIIREYGDEVTVSDEQRALRHLNYLVRDLNLEKKYISYLTTIDQSLVVGQEEYIFDLVDIDYIYFLLGETVRTQIYIKDIAYYFSRATISNVQGIPQIGYIEPQPDYTIKLFIYMPSSNAWTISVKGRKKLNQFERNDVIAPELQPYVPYFVYALANRLRQVEQADVNPFLLKEEKRQKSILFDNRPLNTQVGKSMALRGRGKGWAGINLAKPWEPC